MPTEIDIGPVPGPISTIKIEEEEGGREVVAEEEEEGSTPKAEESRLRPTLVCPPAPQKLRPVKRKSGPPPQGFCYVPEDLASLFVPVSSYNPPSKRIRVG
ncbi:uncharacterized protein A4U43_C05F35130 [Asparagus officinalis]|uniref:Uncharacterized protein n=1 Tax=Asparagus officinalis TaxID=4686 RepID=A0A5P1EX05_ASPOF|nr:uncharacterized protein A4U43_C05F35130 [Asparagus officinalis]